MITRMTVKEAEAFKPKLVSKFVTTWKTIDPLKMKYFPQYSRSVITLNDDEFKVSMRFYFKELQTYVWQYVPVIGYKRYGIQVCKESGVNDLFKHFIKAVTLPRKKVLLQEMLSPSASTALSSSSPFLVLVMKTLNLLEKTRVDNKSMLDSKEATCAIL